MTSMERLVCVADFEKATSQALDKNTWEFIKSGSDDEYCTENNRSAFNCWLLRPRMLRDVNNRDLSVTILGRKLKVPMGVCPMGFQRTMHPDGEVASAKAAAAVGGIFILSFYGTSSIEEISVAAPNGRNWLQIFLHKDRELTKKLVRRAEKSGFEAIVLTVDAQFVGKRRPSRRNLFKFPAHLRLPNALPGPSDAAMDFDKLHSGFEYALTWEAIHWLRKVTHLPIVVKGIQTVEDAILCVSNGANAIIVSNHGGRQLDTCLPTINMLPSIVKAVNDECEVYLDSGITKGTDIFKALALGARMVFVGRSLLYGIVVNGACGGTKIMEILKDELDLTMTLSGVRTVSEITKDYVVYSGSVLSDIPSAKL